MPETLKGQVSKMPKSWPKWTFLSSFTSFSLIWLHISIVAMLICMKTNIYIWSLFVNVYAYEPLLALF